MSSRLARLLLRLYPRRIRDRYGNELLDLHDELRAHDHVSRPRLIKDMLAGAILTRPIRRRYLAIAGLLAICGTVTVGVVLSGSSSSTLVLRASAQAPRTGNGVYYPPTTTAATPVAPGATPRAHTTTPRTQAPRIGNGVYYPPTATPATPAAPGSTLRARTTTPRTG